MSIYVYKKFRKRGVLLDNIVIVCKLICTFIMITPARMGIHVKCQSIEKSLVFYRELGFTPVFAYGSAEFTQQFTCPTAPENYSGVTFEIGGGLFEIADGHIAVKSEVFKEHIGSSKISAMFDVASVDDLIEVCRKNDIQIAVAPRVFPWGTKEVVLIDPDGFVLVFREVLKK